MDLRMDVRFSTSMMTIFLSFEKLNNVSILINYQGSNGKYETGHIHSSNQISMK